jgi:hypothetical protein
LEIGREICSFFENTENNLNKSAEEEAPYMNFDIQDANSTAKFNKPPLSNNENAPVLKTNEEDYDDVDRFMEENNLG